MYSQSNFQASSRFGISSVLSILLKKWRQETASIACHYPFSLGPISKTRLGKGSDASRNVNNLPQEMELRKRQHRLSRDLRRYGKWSVEGAKKRCKMAIQVQLVVIGVQSAREVI